ncbi:MAG: S8 family serine peptidase, partial [Ignavibacteriales bacterium]|nr:S8 family serine peptidase [Ignavibacteriales bacterium]
KMKKAILLFLFLFSTNIFSQFDVIQIDPNAMIIDNLSILRTEKTMNKLTSDLNILFEKRNNPAEMNAFISSSGLEVENENVMVEILFDKEIGLKNVDMKVFDDLGVVIIDKSTHSIYGYIPIKNLINVAESYTEIKIITRPIRPVETAITSEGVGLMNADFWQSIGYNGSGVKVAVIDGGFQKLTLAQGNGDIPPTYVSQDFTGSGLEATTEHGTAVAEAVYDVAPGASLYLYKIASYTNLVNAVDACISNGVHIVNHSMGWNIAGGYYDGTGYVCDEATRALNNGILWVNAAGNEADYHYRGTFLDYGDGSHDFSGNGTGNLNAFGPSPGYVYSIPTGVNIRLYMNWNNYPTTNQDYDLYLFKHTTGWNVVAASTNTQDGTTPPEEYISYTTSGTSTYYAYYVYQYSATQNVDFTIFNGRISETWYYQKSSSLVDPGTVTDVVTVGAIDRLNYASGPQEDFSCQGPTTDGRTKPDVTSPDNCNSYAYGYWYGTSLSSPHVAGVFAILKQRFPGYTNAQLRNHLYTKCTVDLGTAGKDNIYGYGKVEMPGVFTALKVFLQGAYR